jgi:cyclopropane fatty-acyl-phospholipid synthase-like methyltransferase
MLHTDFDYVAQLYPFLEQIVFGSTLNKARRSFNDQLDNGQEILLIGEGNGRFLAEILAREEAASITVVDSSAKMLAALERRIRRRPGRNRVRLVKADLLKWSAPTVRFDRLITHFFLDLFEPPNISFICQKFATLAAKEALWLDVDFALPANDLRYDALMWTQYRFFRLLAGIEASRLHDPLLSIEAAGWRIEEEKRLASGRICARRMAKKVLA